MQHLPSGKQLNKIVQVDKLLEEFRNEYPEFYFKVEFETSFHVVISINYRPKAGIVINLSSKVPMEDVELKSLIKQLSLIHI